MKVKIGPYLNWVGPYQIAEKILFWIPKYKTDEDYIEGRYNPAYKKYVEPFQKFLAGKDKDTWFAKACQWVHDKKKRKIKVHIDNYDVWSADHTLALIILPTLKKLREVKHGSPLVDIEDVPENLHYTDTEDWDTQMTFPFYNEDGILKVDCDIHTRWNWVLNEMIFAFECIVDDSWEEDFNIPCEPRKIHSSFDWTMNYTIDYEGMRKVEERIQNGLCLFGKYFRALWD